MLGREVDPASGLVALTEHRLSLLGPGWNFASASYPLICLSVSTFLLPDSAQRDVWNITLSAHLSDAHISVAGAAATKGCRLGGLKNSFAPQPWRLKVEIKVSAGLVPSDTPLLGSETAVSSLHPHTVFPLCVPVS